MRRHLPTGDRPTGHRRHRYRYWPRPRRSRPAAAAWAAGERNFLLCLPCVSRGRTAMEGGWGGGGCRQAACFKILSTWRLRVRSAARKEPPGTSHLGWAHRRRDGDGCGSGEHREESKRVRSSPTCEHRDELEPHRSHSLAAPGGSVTSPRFSVRRGRRWGRGCARHCYHGWDAARVG